MPFKRILFVCTGNACRSPMAEAIFRESLKAYFKEDFEVSSAGTSAFDGGRATNEAIKVLSEIGLDISSHKTHSLNKELVEKSDIVLVMEERHKNYILSFYKEAEKKVFLLTDYANGLFEENFSAIEDPIGQGEEAYRRILHKIKENIEKIVKRWRKKIAIASDHAGFILKSDLISYLSLLGYEIKDFGAYNAEVSMDYPDFAFKVAKVVGGGEFDWGILICGTGLGMSIVANKFPGIRATLCSDLISAHFARSHNDANILVLPGRFMTQFIARRIVWEWLNTDFSGGRHERRLQKIKQIEKEVMEKGSISCTLNGKTFYE